MTDADWIREGQPAVEYRTNYNGPDGTTPATIAKLTKTQIVLSNGERYRRSDLHKVGEGHSYSGHTKLVPPTDPRIRDVKARRTLRKLTTALETIAGSGLTAGEADVLAAIDRMERTVRAARQAITGEKA